ncbi:glycosyltransferase family 4 protein [Adhaeribacter rhizoryzae]|uniref:Glycosyltransferase family 4 protein n=2 Tax=Adhaeribacter rhizoryzae TaxID=2607907 RepID=A0A5M6DHK0_9BACT|nr:glycosyltransferase family 4 protein [Adhaeribacter rhizoryzae]
MDKLNQFALVHDWLPLIGGAEKVLEAIHQLYGGPIYTLIQHPENLRNSYFEGKPITSSFIQKLPFAKNKYRNYLALFPYAIEQFDLRQHEVIISSSYAVAKGVITNANQLHICYCHSPVRYAWDLYHQYLEEANLQRGIKGMVAKTILHYLRNWDIASVNRVDYFIANSEYIAKRIKKLYRREATVIYPPVDVDKFELCKQKEEFYVTASRMVPYKKIDLIVEAFAQMPDKKLVVIGDGPDFNKIKAKASANIELLGYQPFEVLKSYMQRAKAFVFAAEEDFGIIPVEAQACGTPVIAYNRGGVKETVINLETGVFFQKQKTASIIAAVSEFEKLKLSPLVIRQNAVRFSRLVFMEKFKNFVDSKYTQFRQE